MMLQTFTFSLVVASPPSLTRLVPASSVLRLVCGGLSTVETRVHVHTFSNILYLSIYISI